MENIKSLKFILDSAPEGATHIETLASTRTYYLKRSISCGVYGYQLWSSDHECFIGSGGASGNVRSLEDIRTIIELYEGLQNAIEACYDLDSFGVRETNSDYINAYKLLERFE